MSSLRKAVSASVGTSITEIPAGARLFSGAIGGQTVNGGIPLRPGQLFANGIGNVSIFEGATERPIRVVALHGTHDDGSLRAIQVQCDLTFATTGEVKSLALRLNQAPTLTSAGVTINKAWVDAPQLLYCTDPAHMCRARLAPLPLIPLSDPAVPARWQTHLTAEFEAIYQEAKGFSDIGQAGGNAEYDWVYEAQCHYLSTANVTWLKRAMEGYVNNAPAYLNYTRLVTQWIPQASAYTPSANPEGLADSGGPAVGQEQWTKVLGAYLLYYLTGWEMARAHVWSMGTWSWGDMQSETAPPIYGPRYWVRWKALPSVVSYLMRNPSQSYTYWVAPDTQSSAINSFVSTQLARRNAVATAAAAFSSGDYRDNIWGFWSSYNDGGAYPPLFQFSVIPPWALLCDYHMGGDSRVAGAIQGICNGVIAACGAKETASYNGYQVYWTRYLWTDPAAGGTKEFPDLMMMFKLPMAHAFAATGDPVYRDWADTIADTRHALFNLTTKQDCYFKELGELFLMSHHACAYRSGVPHNGWWA